MIEGMEQEKKIVKRGKKKLKMYVWEDIFRDHTAGMAVALASNVETARKLIIKKLGRNESDLLEDPKVITKPDAFYVYGGG